MDRVKLPLLSMNYKQDKVGTYLYFIYRMSQNDLTLGTNSK
jgi:hypothetical protein